VVGKRLDLSRECASQRRDRAPDIRARPTEIEALSRSSLLATDRLLAILERPAWRAKRKSAVGELIALRIGALAYAALTASLVVLKPRWSAFRRPLVAASGFPQLLPPDAFRAVCPAGCPRGAYQKTLAELRGQ